jgi:hypothetical protein
VLFLLAFAPTIVYETVSKKLDPEVYRYGRNEGYI